MVIYLSRILGRHRRSLAGAKKVFVFPAKRHHGCPTVVSERRLLVFDLDVAHWMCKEIDWIYFSQVLVCPFDLWIKLA
jgi:hypothetical protein